MEVVRELWFVRHLGQLYKRVDDLLPPITMRYSREPSKKNTLYRLHSAQHSVWVCAEHPHKDRENAFDMLCLLSFSVILIPAKIKCVGHQTGLNSKNRTAPVFSHCSST